MYLHPIDSFTILQHQRVLTEVQPKARVAWHRYLRRLIAICSDAFRSEGNSFLALGINSLLLTRSELVRSVLQLLFFMQNSSFFST